MKRVIVVLVFICSACLILSFMPGGNLLAMVDETPTLTAEQAIAAARRNAKPGSSFTVLRGIIANAATRRIGDQAFGQAQARKFDLYQNGILIEHSFDFYLKPLDFERSTQAEQGKHQIAYAPISLDTDS